MSTRVHELAKELGLKSQDLIDRMQKQGLDVKPSPLASLDEVMVERVKRLIEGNPEASGPVASAPATAPTPRPSTTHPPETPAISPTATAPRKPASSEAEPNSTATNLPERPRPSPPPPAQAQAPTSAAPATSASGSLTSAPARGPISSTPPASGGQAPPQHRGSAPLSSHTRPGGGSSRQAGPLAGHTPHRDRGTGGPPPRPGQQPPVGRGPVSSAPSESRPGPSGSQPLKRSDYIPPAGTRGSVPGRPQNLGASQPPLRRSESGGGEGSSRREGPSGPRTGRPLPPVASPTAPPTSGRRPEPSRPSAPEGNVQRPDMKFTPAQLLEMRKSGQLPHMPGAGGPGGKPGAPGRGAPVGPGPRKGPAAPAAGLGVPPPPVDEEDDRRNRHGRVAAGAGAGAGAGATDRAGRREKRSQRAVARRGSGSPQPTSTLLDSDDDSRGRGRGPRRHGRGSRNVAVAPRKTEAQIEPPITVRTLSEAIGVKASDILRKLINIVGLGVNINSSLDDELAMELSMELGVELEVVRQKTAEEEMLDFLEAPQDEDAAQLELRPPVITILGHVDHGKTSLLDKIRRANVVDTETGGITQHIGAYQIEHNGRKIAFVDTPGHEAFTSMRARGANVTDMVVLVVAADDGVMPQTVEAIAHARAAEVPVIVALNKIDLANVETQSNINKIYGELAQQGLNPAEWGGETEIIRTSTLSGRGLDDLLSTLETLAELLELKSNPNRPGSGTCLEASISEGRGVVATVLVQEGTLHVGDIVVCGDAFGRVRALYDDKGRSVQEAGPSTPVEISGLDQVPEAGEKFAVLDDIGRAREIAETRRARGRGATLGERQAVTLENIYTRMAEQSVKSLNLILKADVQGSLEALSKELEKLKNDEVPIRILLKGVGGVSESDVMLAEASDAIIIGFRVAPEDRAMSLAEEKKIDIRRYDIIYQVTDEIKKAVEGMLVPEIKEVHLGRATVRQVFKISKVGTVAGCFVTQGIIERSAKARIIREGREIYKGTIDALKRFKDDIREVRENFECGIKISNYDDIKVDDTIECYRIDVIRRTL